MFTQYSDMHKNAHPSTCTQKLVLQLVEAKPRIQKSSREGNLECEAVAKVISCVCCPVLYKVLSLLDTHKPFHMLVHAKRCKTSRRESSHNVMQLQRLSHRVPVLCSATLSSKETQKPYLVHAKVQHEKLVPRKSKGNQTHGSSKTFFIILFSYLLFSSSRGSFGFSGKTQSCL